MKRKKAEREIVIKKWRDLGTSLAVQWLRLQVPNAGTRYLVRELDPACHDKDFKVGAAVIVVLDPAF